MDRIEIPDLNTVNQDAALGVYRTRCRDLYDDVLMRDAKIAELMAVATRLQAQVDEVTGGKYGDAPADAGGYPTQGPPYTDTGV